jgi:type IV secretory pathway TrbL component
MAKKLSKEVKAARKKPGGSNVGKYKGVKEFAGTAGGAPKGSYPINTKQRAKSALKLAHNGPNPQGIKGKVYQEYPSLKKSKGKKK